MLRLFVIGIILLSFFESVMGQEEFARNLNLQFYSKILQENREVNIQLPDDYKATYYSYPVIFILDAEKNYTQVLERLNFMMDNHFIPKHIVIGVVNSDRMRDMTPEDSVLQKSIFPTKGGADHFISFLEDELIIELSKQYRLSTKRTIIGHNYSALLVTYAFIKRPDLFDRFLAFSPTLWWNNNAIVKELEVLLEKQSSLRKHFFLSFGEEAKKMLLACKSFIKLMDEKRPADLKWSYEWMPDLTHYDVYQRSLMNGMELMFKDYQYPSIHSFKEKGIALANSYQKSILLNYGRNEKLPYSLLESVCLELKDEKKYQKALSFLQFTLINYPQRGDAYFYAGEVFEELGNYNKAVKFYEIACEKDKGRWDFEQKYTAMQQKIEEIKNSTIVK